MRQDCHVCRVVDSNKHRELFTLEPPSWWVVYIHDDDDDDDDDDYAGDDDDDVDDHDDNDQELLYCKYFIHKVSLCMELHLSAIITLFI